VSDPKRSDYFKTPFDVRAGDANQIAQEELRAAGIPILTATFKEGCDSEFGAAILGVLWCADGAVIAFSREHRFWSVRSSTPLPYVNTKGLNDLFSDTVRINGMSDEDDVDSSGCDYWHVNSHTGLGALAMTLTGYFGIASGNTTRVTVAMLAKLGLINGSIYE